MSVKTSRFDIAEYLDTEESVVDFLKEVAETGDSSDFIHALGIAARARGMTDIARDAGVTRASLYKSLSDGGNPRFDTINKIVNALGMKLTVAA